VIKKILNMKYRGINKETEIKLEKFFQNYTNSNGDIKQIIKSIDISKLDKLVKKPELNQNK